MFIFKEVFRAVQKLSNPLLGLRRHLVWPAFIATSALLMLIQQTLYPIGVRYLEIVSLAHPWEVITSPIGFSLGLFFAFLGVFSLYVGIHVICLGKIVAEREFEKFNSHLQ